MALFCFSRSAKCAREHSPTMAMPEALKPIINGNSDVPAASWHSLMVDSRDADRVLCGVSGNNSRQNTQAEGREFTHSQGWHVEGDVAPPLE